MVFGLMDKLLKSGKILETGLNIFARPNIIELRNLHVSLILQRHCLLALGTILLLLFTMAQVFDLSGQKYTYTSYFLDSVFKIQVRYTLKTHRGYVSRSYTKLCTG